MGMTDHAWSLINGSMNGVLIVSDNVLIVLNPINIYLVLMNILDVPHNQ